MSRVAFLIDGFNLYHSMMSDPRLRKCKWLNLRRLAESLVTKSQQIVSVNYFTAFAPWDSQKVAKHRTYVRALERAGVVTVLGEFRKRRQEISALLDRRRETRILLSNNTYEEKRTDVNIALHLFRLAVENKYDEAMIVSADSDLAPAIDLVRRAPYNKFVRIIVPPNQLAKELCQAAGQRTKLGEHHFQSSMFPLIITPPKGPVIECPAEWR